ncbi:TetR/AcrR family transcriptional regulator [Carnobacterium maltaromaticum]|uniref:TetR/AcrR family transcriptional regulator n=1 Tax=Carnobacterium maltaromaticum TaxID=2751 RepID=UPI00295E97D8|nr:TetR/AcrR family transcriptional regulator [Carnobacterium maltaromaticum]
MEKLTRKEEMQLTREKILKEAQILFMQKGYKSTSTREIAQQSKITQPALYHHFKDKETLYIEVIRELTTSVKKELDKILKKETDPETKLSGMILTLIDLHPTNIMLMIHDILNEMQPENQYLLFQLSQDTYSRPFDDFFTEMQEKGLLRPEVSARAAAKFVVTSISPMFNGNQKFAEKTPMSEQVRELTDFMLHGVFK